MQSLLTRFGYIVAGIRTALGPAARAEPARNELLFRLWNYLGGATQRLERLYARFRAGTLPKPRPPRPPRAPRAAPPVVPPVARPRLPTGTAWLARSIRATISHGLQLQHFLTEPDVAEFLAAAPQAGRIFRPLCRMLGAEPPASIAPPPPPPRPPRLPKPPRVKRPKRPQDDPLWYPNFEGRPMRLRPPRKFRF